MTPSSWHDDARNRDAGHDDMQAGFYRHEIEFGNPSLSSQTKNSLTGEPVITSYRRVCVYFEAALFRGDTIVSFVDVLSEYEQVIVIDPKRPENAPRPDKIWFCFEIKPCIYSVGATIRQCRALEHIASLSTLWPTARDYRRPNTTIHVAAVVPYNDPKIGLLKELGSPLREWKATPK